MFSTVGSSIILVIIIIIIIIIMSLLKLVTYRTCYNIYKKVIISCVNKCFYTRCA